jgi:hypothetical protein
LDYPRPLRVFAVSLLLALEGLFFVLGSVAMVTGVTADRMSLVVLGDHYVLGSPFVLWIAGPLGILLGLASIVAILEIRFRLVLLAGFAATLVSFVVGVVTGEWAWLVAQLLLMALIVWGRASYAD